MFEELHQHSVDRSLRVDCVDTKVDCDSGLLLVDVVLCRSEASLCCRSDSYKSTSRVRLKGTMTTESQLLVFLRDTLWLVNYL